MHFRNSEYRIELEFVEFQIQFDTFCEYLPYHFIQLQQIN